MDRSGSRPVGHDRARPVSADDVLAAALVALRVWSERVGIEPARAIGRLAGLVVDQRVCALLGLRPAGKGTHPGWNATDDAGQTYQIEARATTERRGTSFDFASNDAFDTALLILYDPSDLALVEVWRMDRAAVLRHASSHRGRLALQWPRSRQFARLVFARDVA